MLKMRSFVVIIMHYSLNAAQLSEHTLGENEELHLKEQTETSQTLPKMLFTVAGHKRQIQPLSPQP